MNEHPQSPTRPSPAPVVDHADLDRFVRNGFPPPSNGGHSLPQEERDPAPTAEEALRDRAERLALAVAGAWITRDFEAQNAMLAEIVALRPYPAGVMLASQTLTTVRLHTLPLGGLRNDVTIWPQWHPPAQLEPEDEARYERCVDVVRDLWTATARLDTEQIGPATEALASCPPDDARTVLWIMAHDVAALLERMAQWRADGYNTLLTTLEDLRSAPA